MVRLDDLGPGDRAVLLHEARQQLKQEETPEARAERLCVESWIDQEMEDAAQRLREFRVCPACGGRLTRSPSSSNEWGDVYRWNWACALCAREIGIDAEASPTYAVDRAKAQDGGEEDGHGTTG